MSKDILYGIKCVEIEEIDPLTQLPTKNSAKFFVDTAETAELEAVVSEGDEEIKRNDTRILAIVRTPDLLYGYDLTFTDNTFDPEIVALIEGGDVRRDSSQNIVGYDSPMLTVGSANMKPFRMSIYVANYIGDSIVNYVKITLNNCEGKAPGMNVGKEFYAPEFTIKAREATKAGLPIKSMDYVATLPKMPRQVTFNLNGGTGDVANLKIIPGEKITPKPADPTLADHTFVGWQVAGESRIWDFDADVLPDRELTLIAKFKKNEAAASSVAEAGGNPAGTPAAATGTEETHTG